MEKRKKWFWLVSIFLGIAVCFSLSAAHSIEKNSRAISNIPPAPPPSQDESQWTFGSLEIDPTQPSCLYVTSEQGAFRSEDGGESWRKLNISSSLSLAWVRLNPANPRQLFGWIVGTKGQPERSLYRSDDGGNSWTKICDDAPFHLHFAPGRTRIYGLPYSRSGALLYSDNQGISWHVLFNPPRRFENFETTSYLQINPQNPDTLALLTVEYGYDESTYWPDYEGAHIYSSLDGGANWNSVDIRAQMFTDSQLCSDPFQPFTLYFLNASGGENFSSTDLGMTLLPMSGFLKNRFTSGENGYDPFGELSGNPLIPFSLYAATRNGIYASFDRGANWSSLGLSGFRINRIAFHPQEASTIYGCTTKGLYRSRDGGANWESIFKVNAPRVTIISPRPHDSIRGVAPIDLQIESAYGPNRVEFYLDNTLLNTYTDIAQGPVRLNLDTTAIIPPHGYYLKVKVFDSRQVTGTAVVPVILKNIEVEFSVVYEPRPGWLVRKPRMVVTVDYRKIPELKGGVTSWKIFRHSSEGRKDLKVFSEADFQDGRYRFTDSDIQPSETYEYMLYGWGDHGESIIFKEVRVQTTR